MALVLKVTIAVPASKEAAFVAAGLFDTVDDTRFFLSSYSPGPIRQVSTTTKAAKGTKTSDPRILLFVSLVFFPGPSLYLSPPLLPLRTSVHIFFEQELTEPTLKRIRGFAV